MPKGSLPEISIRMATTKWCARSLHYIGPDYTTARELYPPTTINAAGVGQHGNYSNCFLSHIHDFTGDGWPDVLMIMGFGPKPNFSAHLFVNPRGELRHWDNYNVVPSVLLRRPSCSTSTATATLNSS